MKRSRDYLLVDGYNIVNSWPILREIAEESLENARLKLINILQDYQGYVGNNIIVVFDAHLKERGIERHEYFGKVHVVYTKEGETADQYIERWVNDRGRKYKIMVASSDYVEQTIILARGGIRISARELYIDIQMATKNRNEKYLYKEKMDGNHLSDNLNPEIFEVLERMRRQR